MDLFGDDDNDEVSLLLNREALDFNLILNQEAKAALEAQKKKNAETKKKDAPIAKSLILFDVKPYEAETDLDALS